MTMRESRCPLCGAKVTAVRLLDNGTEVVDLHQHVLGTHCPYCQGYLELLPSAGKLEVGYLSGPGKSLFEATYALRCEGLEVRITADDPPRLSLTAGERHWEFTED